MLGREFLWASSLALSLTGCGGGDGDQAQSSASSGLAGIYQTLSDDYYQPCDGTAESLGIEPPYFQLVDEALQNGLFVDVYPCTGSDTSTCDDENTGSPLIFLAKQIGDKTFRAEAATRSGDDVDCTASYSSDDVKQSPQGVTLTSEERFGAWTGADCAAEFGDALASKARTLPCFQREIWEGRRL